MNILIPMAGRGNRFTSEGFDKPKPLITINKQFMIELAINSLNIVGDYIFIIRQYEEEEYNKQLVETLNKLVKNPVIIPINYVTEGPASSCLLAKRYVDSNLPLIIANCDQILEWDSKKFIEHVNNSDCDGCVVTYKSNTIKNSYVKLNNDGKAIEFAEKKVISEHSLNGIHYWKKGVDFVESAIEMIRYNDRTNNEFYIAPTYNYMIKKGKQIINYDIEPNQHWAVGTPSDLELYKAHIYANI